MRHVKTVLQRVLQNVSEKHGFISTVAIDGTLPSDLSISSFAAKKTFLWGTPSPPAPLRNVPNKEMPQIHDFYKNMGIFFAIRPIWPENFSREVLAVVWSQKKFETHIFNI